MNQLLERFMRSSRKNRGKIVLSYGCPEQPDPMGHYEGEATHFMKQLNLQDVFLNQARREKITVTIYLTNGFQFKGVVKGFDSFTVILDCDGRQNLVYKHAISTIIPAKAISILDASQLEKADDV